MAGTIVVDRLESDASYASSINVASPMVISNTLTMASSSRISGDITVGTTRSPNTSARIEVSGNADVGLLVRQTGNTSYAGIRLYNIADSSSRALEIDYSSPGYPGGLLSGGPTGESASIGTTGAYPLALGTNNTARLIIDASGRVTMPNTPMFSAYGITGSISSGTILACSSEFFDVGLNYNTSTGRFTAPVAGKYFFTAQLFCVNSTTGTYQGLQFRKNGTNLEYTMYNYIDTTNDVFITNTKIIDLAVNDYVEVRFEIGSGTQNQSRITLDGFLVG